MRLPRGEYSRGDDDDERSRNRRYTPALRGRDGDRTWYDAKCRHRLGYVFNLLGADVLKADRKLVLDLIEGAAGNTDAARLCLTLQPGRNVDPVAIQIITLDHHVADIDADAELHLVFFGQLRVFDPQFFLDRNGTAHCLDRAAELGDDAIAAGAKDAAIMFGD